MLLVCAHLRAVHMCTLSAVQTAASLLGFGCAGSGGHACGQEHACYGRRVEEPPCFIGFAVVVAYVHKRCIDRLLQLFVISGTLRACVYVGRQAGLHHLAQLELCMKLVSLRRCADLSDTSTVLHSDAAVESVAGVAC